MKTHLEVKIAALASESRIIRHKKEKWLKRARKPRKASSTPGWMWLSLHNYRTNFVRKELRSSHLALAFLRGFDYWDIERFARTEPNWQRVRKLAHRFNRVDPSDPTSKKWYWSSGVLDQKFRSWAENGDEYFWNENKKKKRESIIKTIRSIITDKEVLYSQ